MEASRAVPEAPERLEGIVGDFRNRVAEQLGDARLYIGRERHSRYLHPYFADEADRRVGRGFAMEVGLVLLSILIGLLMGQWWSLALALPVGLMAATWFSFEGFSGPEVDVLFGIVVALGLLVGTAARKGLGRPRGHRQMGR